MATQMQNLRRLVHEQSKLIELMRDEEGQMTLRIIELTERVKELEEHIATRN